MKGCDIQHKNPISSTSSASAVTLWIASAMMTKLFFILSPFLLFRQKAQSGITTIIMTNYNVCEKRAKEHFWVLYGQRRFIELLWKSSLCLSKFLRKFIPSIIIHDIFVVSISRTVNHNSKWPVNSIRNQIKMRLKQSLDGTFSH